MKTATFLQRKSRSWKPSWNTSWCGCALTVKHPTQQTWTNISNLYKNTEFLTAWSSLITFSCLYLNMPFYVPCLQPAAVTQKARCTTACVKAARILLWGRWRVGARARRTWRASAATAAGQTTTGWAAVTPWAASVCRALLLFFLPKHFKGMKVFECTDAHANTQTLSSLQNTQLPTVILCQGRVPGKTCGKSKGYQDRKYMKSFAEHVVFYNRLGCC